jgi:hypothetical protein
MLVGSGVAAQQPRGLSDRPISGGSLRKRSQYDINSVKLDRLKQVSLVACIRELQDGGTN